MRYAGIDWESTVNGDGFRLVLYLQGCKHHCKGCHNEQTWDPKGGTELERELLEKAIKTINEGRLYEGITLSGGDPFCNFDNLLELLKLLKRELLPGKTIWCYTGYTYEELIDLGQIESLKLIDVLVDGKFIKELNDNEHKFRGSSNQRIIYLKNGGKIKWD